MNFPIKIFTITCAVLMLSCGRKEEKKEGFSLERKKTVTEKSVALETEGNKASDRVDLENKGVGPITALSLSEDIDGELVTQGKELYKKNCLACHRIGKKFIGSAPNGILERRSPEWIMNMILNPKLMVKEDPLAKQLLIESNSSTMEDQELTQEQARAILEYFRTL